MSFLHKYAIWEFPGQRFWLKLKNIHHCFCPRNSVIKTEFFWTPQCSHCSFSILYPFHHSKLSLPQATHVTEACSLGETYSSLLLASTAPPLLSPLFLSLSLSLQPALSPSLSLSSCLCHPLSNPESVTPLPSLYLSFSFSPLSLSLFWEMNHWRKSGPKGLSNMEILTLEIRKHENVCGSVLKIDWVGSFSFLFVYACGRKGKHHWE